ncbi:RNAse III [Isosphaera pallida ATCC 43644]|jgi:ribonuclease-3|uniref:Ribonuclease 3 n=1 Tax=Isosphaera pallida (strain ATCC 43644 / DSM 9630 / IS1B) TaxID=575540 RepID=E8R1J8_ISOPI|nr:ribonuclease III [Isosphaera pallida]ADV63416.1 RNAse III [Isosphaera pallida ATCC 43644]
MSEPDDSELLASCERVIGHSFQDRGLLRAALTHSSRAVHPLASNERLEFLGDSVLGMIVCDTLFHLFPEAKEGDLTRIKSVVVSRQTCTKIARKLGLQNYLLLGKGMGPSSQAPASTLANVFESVVGAIYLDSGFEAARRFVLNNLLPEIESSKNEESQGNYKSQLQQYAQKNHGTTPTYHLLEEKGPDHRKCFKILARIGSHQFPPAWGQTKKDAEQRAAQNALSVLRGLEAPFHAD